MAENRYKRAEKVFPISLGPGDRAFESYYSAPLKSMISEGPFSSLIPAAQNLSRLTLSIYTGGLLGLSPQ